MTRARVRSGGWVIVLLLLLASGCSSGGEEVAAFEDDFEDPESGWGMARRSRFVRGYGEGIYYFEMYKEDWLTWTHSEAEYADVRVEVFAFLASEQREGHFGLFCRHVDDDNFYYLAVSPDGYYGIFRRVDGGDLEVLTGDGDAMLPSAAIETGGRARNRLRAVCAGDNLSLIVNGQLVDAVVDDTHARGHVGFGVGSGPVGGIRVHFDDWSGGEP